METGTQTLGESLRRKRVREEPRAVVGPASLGLEGKAARAHRASALPAAGVLLGQETKGGKPWLQHGSTGPPGAPP